MLTELYGDYLAAKIETYFIERTPEHKGIVDYVIHQPNAKADTVIVNDNDYLRLANHPEITEAQVNALKAQKHEVVMSAVFLSEDNLENKIEKKFAAFVGKQAAYFSQSGFTANLSLVEAICMPNAPVYIDHRSHASFWEGLKVAKPNIIMFRHNNIENLEKKIIKYGSGVILVDSVYSAHGTICDLPNICRIKEKYGCVLVVDESHSLGLYGDNGAGLVNMLRLTDKVDFITASLSKAFCTRAGLIAGQEKSLVYLREYATAPVFSSAIANYDIVRIDKMLDLISGSVGDSKRQQLHHNMNYLRKELREMQVNVVDTQIPSPIISLMGGIESVTKKLKQIFDDHNIYAAPFCLPATSKNGSLLRVTVNSDLTIMQMNYILQVMADIKKCYSTEDFPELFLS